MKILITSSEVVPFIKTGGLGDVTGTLINEYQKMGIKAAIIMPLYRKIKNSAGKFEIRPIGKEISIPLGNKLETGKLWEGKTPKGTSAYFIENSRFYDRDDLYGTLEGDFHDNASRFIFYDRAVLETLKTLKLDFDIIHCNDWQTGLIPVYIKTIYKDFFPNTSTLMTIHNLGYQGIFAKSSMPLTGLGWKMFNMEGLEFFGNINFLKAGILYADMINTVSSNYAKEILTEELGFGLHNVLNKRRDSLKGLVNGIDYTEWNPEKDEIIQAKYSKNDLSAKTICKESLQKICGLSYSKSMLIGMVTRFSSQKGLDLVAEAMDEIIRSGINMVMLGIGDRFFHKIFTDLQKKHFGKLSVILGFDNALAHKIYAGSDVFLMPSKYEPCGLGQLIALRYGAIPVVRGIGGLLDTIVEYNPAKGSGTGFSFSDYSSDELLTTIKKTNEIFNLKEHWPKIQKNAMSQDFSWSNSAKEYLSLYQSILNGKHK